MRNVRLDTDTAYISDNPSEMVGQYLRVNLQAHLVMDDFLLTHFFHRPEVAPHITLYLFEKSSPWKHVSYLKQGVEAKSKTLNKMEKTYK